jgi:hypothetical protein
MIDIHEAQLATHTDKGGGGDTQPVAHVILLL